MNRLLYLMLLLTACSAHTVNTNTDSVFPPPVDTVGIQLASTKYLPTGFYYLAEKGQGIEKWAEKADSLYTISPLPFVSGKNLKKAILQKRDPIFGDQMELCIFFDSKGTKDLAEGTGNPKHPEFAVIIANKLIYVVESIGSVKKGVVYLGLSGYSDDEMKAMCDAVNSKK